MERFARKAATLLNRLPELTNALGAPVEASQLEIPADRTLGDFAFPCFRLAKSMGKAPPQIAKDLVAKLPPEADGLRVVATGPYINFQILDSATLGALLQDILAGPGVGTYGQVAANSRLTWVLEYSSPNLAKHFQIYHLRPTALGAALDRIGRYRGHKMITVNHLGDWGTQWGKLAIAYDMFKAELPAQPSIGELVDIYVKFHAAAEKDPTLEDRAREASLKLEQGDPKMVALWKQVVDVSLAQFQRIYGRLGIRFDHYWGESHYKDMTGPLIEDWKKRGILVQSEGAWVVPVTDEKGKELPPCILQRSDGATIYATRDVAAAIYRHDQFKFDRMSYIVGSEQKLHFQQFFQALKKAGHAWVDRCEHIPTGIYRFKDAKMSTRKGNFVTLEDVLDLANERARELMSRRHAEQAAKAAASGDESAAASVGGANPQDKDFSQIAEQVGTGAVVFSDLSTDPARDVMFELERVVDFEGETGPYLQYAHTRCLSIIRKARERGELKTEMPVFTAEAAARLTAPQEVHLLKTLGQFPLQLERTLEMRKASQLSHFLIDVTKDFGAFYRECRVLGEAPATTEARLLLVEATRRVLAQGLRLLGIPMPARM
ncbi:MAG: arginine--tRNA ligase [Bacteriovoracia bacterium]